MRFGNCLRRELVRKATTGMCAALCFAIAAILISTGSAVAQDEMSCFLLIDEDCIDNSSPAILELATVQPSG